MLNYIWAGLVVFSLVFALTTDIQDLRHDTYRNGKSFRLRGQGMPQLGQPDKRGDLYADVTVILPTHLNEEQRRLFEAFARSIGYDG